MRSTASGSARLDLHAAPPERQPQLDEEQLLERQPPTRLAPGNAAGQLFGKFLGKVRLAQRFRQREQPPALAHRFREQVLDEADVLVDRPLLDAPERPGRDAFDVAVDRNHAPEGIVVTGARRLTGRTEELDVRVVHHLAATAISLPHLAGDHRLRLERKALQEAGPVMEPDADQRSTCLVADQHFQPPPAAARLLRLDNLPGDHRPLADRRLRNRARSPPILVAARQVEEQVPRGPQALGLELFRDGGAHAAELDDGGGERIRGGLRRRGSFFGHGREPATRP